MEGWKTGGFLGGRLEDWKIGIPPTLPFFPSSGPLLTIDRFKRHERTQNSQTREECKRQPHTPFQECPQIDKPMEQPRFPRSDETEVPAMVMSGFVPEIFKEEIPLR